MNNLNLEILKKRWRFVVFIGLVFAVLALALSFIFPLEYRADAQVLIISKSRYGTDPYTAIKSAERVGENLVQVVWTNDFFSKVVNQPGYSVDRSPFENISEVVKRKRWQKALSANVVYGTSIMNISAYSRDPKSATELAGAASSALVVQGWEYVGGDVQIKLVNNPVVSRFPVRPNLPVNAVIGFLIGVVMAMFVTVRRYKV